MTRFHPVPVFLHLFVGEHQRTNQKRAALALGSGIPHILGDILIERKAHGNIGGIPEAPESVFRFLVNKAGQIQFRCFGDGVAHIHLIKGST